MNEQWLSQTYHSVCNKSNRRRLEHVEHEIVTLPEHLSPLLVSSRLHVGRTLVLCVLICISLLNVFFVCFFVVAIQWCVLRVTDSVELSGFGIFKHFLSKTLIHLTP